MRCREPGRSSDRTLETCRFSASSVSSGKNSQAWLRVSQPSPPVALVGLPAVEDQDPGVHVGVGVEVVGVGVVGVVLVDPPAVAQPVEQVPGQQAERPAGVRVAGDLAMARVVAEEAELRGHDREDRREQDRPPGVAEQEHGADRGDAAEQDGGQHAGVVDGPWPQQAEAADLRGELGVAACG